jgi:hypothetical protein
VRLMVKKYADQYPATAIEDLPADTWGFMEHLLADISDRLERLYQIQIEAKDRSMDGFQKRPGQTAVQTKTRGASAWFSGMGLEE